MNFYNVFDVKKSFTKIPLQGKIKKIFISYLLILFFIAISIVLIHIIDYLVTEILHYNSILSEFKKSHEDRSKYSVIKIVLIAPVIEEILFRLALRRSKLNLAIFASFLYFAAFYKSFYKISLVDINFYYVLTTSFVVGFIFYSKSNYFPKINLIEFKMFTIISITLFGLMHINNIKPIFNLVLFYPFYVIPQMIMAYFITNIRLKFNFWWGVILHCFINLTSIILHTITQ
ncbi:hypothetical protein ACR1PO_06905 [Chryseobacterium sp. RRHN12]|uniref:hypothetical protein n=1 Tax=Chryseobacterium sp. RRHN12 TaxID=3437884 RepID=UPI002FC9A500